MDYCEQILHQFEEHQFAIIDSFIPFDECAEMVAYIDQLDLNGELRPATVSKLKTLASDIRSDRLAWLPLPHPSFLKHQLRLEELIPFFNQSFYLSIKRLELFAAKYPKNSFYKKHLDHFNGSRERLITAVCYLNEPEGGELDLFSPNHPEQVLHRMKPTPGRLVLFRSDLFPHEVNPTQSNRYSITGWYRSDE